MKKFIIWGIFTVALIITSLGSSVMFLKDPNSSIVFNYAMYLIKKNDVKEILHHYKNDDIRWFKEQAIEYYIYLNPAKDEIRRIYVEVFKGDTSTLYKEAHFKSLRNLDYVKIDDIIRKKLEGVDSIVDIIWMANFDSHHSEDYFDFSFAASREVLPIMFDASIVEYKKIIEQYVNDKDEVKRSVFDFKKAVYWMYDEVIVKWPVHEKFDPLVISEDQ